MRQQCLSEPVCGVMDIFEAVRQGHEETVSSLLDADPTLLEERDVRGDRPLTLAAQANQLEMVTLLAQRGANINATGLFGLTALHLAVQYGHKGVVELLLGRGAQAGIGDEDGIMPLMEAFRLGHLHMMQRLRQHMGEEGVQMLAEMGWTPLMEASASGQLEEVQMLLQSMGPQELDAEDEWGRTALRWAAEGGQEAMVAFLLSKGAQASSRDRMGMRPIMVAALGDHLGVVQMLVPHLGAEGVDETDDQGWTALHWAAEGKHEEVAAFLLSKGAQLGIRTAPRSQTPFMHAAYFNHLGMVRLLVQHMGGQGLDQKDDDGSTVLHIAAFRHHEDVVQALLLAGAEPTIRDHQGRTPQALAEEKGSKRCMRVFEWWEGELERRYLLQRARCLHDAFTTHQDKPTAPMPAFQQDRAAAGHALPEVEVVAGEHDEGQAGASGKRRASNEADSTEEQEEEGCAVLEYVVRGLNEQLLNELVQGFHAAGRNSEVVAVDDGSSAQGDDDDEEGVEGAEGGL